MRLSQVIVVITLVMLWLASQVHARNSPASAPIQLPETHEYQKVLRQYMATLTEKDFTHGVTEKIPADKATDSDPEYLYRNYILGLTHQPLVGTKRGWPSVNTPPALFLLSAIETPNGVMKPCVYPEAVMALAQWDYSGNLYRNNRGLKMRAFVGGAVAMMMKLTRFNGAVVVTFDKPRRVKLSPAEWADTWFTKSTSRNVTIDMLESGDKPAAGTGAKKIGYRMEPVAK